MSTPDELVRRVDKLTDATTELIDTTNVGLRELNAAVDSSKGSAQAADASEKISKSKAAEAIAARNEAVEAKEQAESIVHNDEGSEIAEQGNYPLAGKSGLHKSWTPLLHAMYPYSGVIGSINKKDVFKFLGSSSVGAANRFELQKGVAFNINGRYVKTDSERWTNIPLQAAESTAARAVAFDDIFLDWNGNVVTHRSITAHRTSTGFDSDAISTEHGYTKVQNGLYRNSDSTTYYLILGRVARRNRGAYHPQYNPEGVARPLTSTGTSWTARYWFSSSDTRTLESVSDCFDFATGNYPWATGHIASLSNNAGSIGSGATTIGYLDDQFYDAVYATDFTPLYYSARNVVDRQALLFDSFNRAVAGETFMGAEGTQSTGQLLQPDNSSHALYSGLTSRLVPRGALNNETIWIRIESTGSATLNSGVALNTLYECESVEVSLSPLAQQRQIRRKSDNLTNWISAGNSSALRVRVFNTRPINSGLPSARPEFLMVDIIGAQSAMPASWLTEGIPGNWLATDEDGGSLIPDGTNKNFKLSRKCLECYQVLESNDKGFTWVDSTSIAKSSFEEADNGIQTPIPANRVLVVFYRTRANPFELSSGGDYLAGNFVGFSAHHQAQYGSVLCSNLIGKVSVAAGVDADYSRIFDVKISDRNSGSSVLRASHAALALNAISINSSPMAKYLPVIKGEAGRYKLKVFAKEVKFTGTSYGDNKQFDGGAASTVVDWQSSSTDDNNASVIVSQKEAELPYHFDGVQY